MMGTDEASKDVLLAAIPFPSIDPVLINLGPLPLRWYALAYIFGLLGGWLYARWIASHPNFWGARRYPSLQSLDDLLVYCAFGVIIGGRLFHILFYAEATSDGRNFYFVHPDQILAVWNGGMAFHGGLIGAVLAMGLFAWRNHTPILSVTDLCGAVAPIGIFFGRLANFIKPELWGRPGDVPWAMVFPGAGPMPRHPSQLYEAGLEGMLLLLIGAVVLYCGGLKRPGLMTGVFAAGYAAARIFCELFREPEPVEILGDFWTKGMIYSLPLLAIGLALILYAIWPRQSQPA